MVELFSENIFKESIVMRRKIIESALCNSFGVDLSKNENCMLNYMRESEDSELEENGVISEKENEHTMQSKNHLKGRNAQSTQHTGELCENKKTTQEAVEMDIGRSNRADSFRQSSMERRQAVENRRKNASVKKESLKKSSESVIGNKKENINGTSYQ